MMATRRKRLILAVVAVVVIVIIGVAGYYLLIPPPPAGPVKIGFHGPLTGPGAADGKSALESALIAIEEINAKGGVRGRPLELVYYDDRLDAEETKALATKLIELDKVVAVVSGSYSGPTRVAAPIFQEAGIPYIAGYATHPEITLAGDYVFRTGMLGPVQGGVVAYSIKEIMGLKKVVCMVGDWDFPQGILEGIQEHAPEVGLEIVAVETFSIKDRDFTALLTKIKGYEPFDVLVIAGLYFHAPAVTQARELGITQPIVGIEGFDSPMFIEIAGPASEGVIITTSLNRDDPREFVQGFMRKYKERTEIDADMVGAMCYDAIRVIATAMEAKGFDPKDIRDGIADLKDFELTAGTMKGFTPTGEVIKPIWLQVVKGGKFRFYAGPITEPEIITPPR
jgi:branched-chain amino acid transport system substrate-binding protein